MSRGVLVLLIHPVFAGDSYRARCTEHGLLAVGSRKHCTVARDVHIKKAHPDLLEEPT